jgi:hypothetical protein
MNNKLNIPSPPDPPPPREVKGRPPSKLAPPKPTGLRNTEIKLNFINDALIFFLATICAVVFLCVGISIGINL